MKSSVHIKLVLFIFLLSLYILTTAGYPTTSMCSSMFFTAKSLIEEGDLALDNPTLETGIGKDGKYYIYEGLAVIIVVAIFTAVSRFIGLFPHGVFVTNHMLTAIACIILFLIGRELKYSKRTSLVIALIYGIGTMAWVHSRYLMPEPLTTVVYLSAFLFLLKYKHKEELKWLFLCGCFTGLALIVRPDAPLFILGLGIGVLALLYIQHRDGKKDVGSIVKGILLFGLPVIFFLAIYAYYNYARFGHVLELGYSTKGQVDETREASESVPRVPGIADTLKGRVDETSEGYGYIPRVRGITDTFVGFAGMWIIPCRSIFFINPVLIFIFWAMKDFWKKYRFEFIIIGIIFILHVFLYSNRGSIGFPGSSAWGVRYMVPMISFMVIIMGMFVEKVISGRHKKSYSKIFTTVFIISVLFQLIGNSMTYHATQISLEEQYQTEEEKWKARKTMNLNPRWNLITQNTKWLLSGRTDLMYYNYLDRENVNLNKYMWERGVPGWVGVSLVLLIITLIVSGYLLFRHLFTPAVEPQQQKRSVRRKKKRRR